MAKIPFTLEAWLKDTSQKVVDKDGRPVRIVCTDADGLYPIIGLVDNKIPLPCGKDGRPPYIGGGGGTLFLVTPEPELSEFEKGYVHIVHKMKLEDFNDEGLKIAKEEAAELFELAKGELTKQGNLILPIEAFEKRYVEAQEKGRKEALKDLPRWKEINSAYYLDKEGFDHGLGILFYRGNKISIAELKKLPGFKEDGHE